VFKRFPLTVQQIVDLESHLTLYFNEESGDYADLRSIINLKESLERIIRVPIFSKEALKELFVETFHDMKVLDQIFFALLKDLKELKDSLGNLCHELHKRDSVVFTGERGTKSLEEVVIKLLTYGVAGVEIQEVFLQETEGEALEVIDSLKIFSKEFSVVSIENRVLNDLYNLNQRALSRIDTVWWKFYGGKDEERKVTWDQLFFNLYESITKVELDTLSSCEKLDFSFIEDSLKKDNSFLSYFLPLLRERIQEENIEFSISWFVRMLLLNNQ